MFAHIEVASDGTCCFIPMFMWGNSKYYRRYRETVQLKGE